MSTKQLDLNLCKSNHLDTKTNINAEFNHCDSHSFNHQEQPNAQITSFYYYCAQLTKRQKKSRKHENIAKHRDRTTMQRFDCNGWMKLIIDKDSREATIKLTHNHHDKYIDIRVTEDVKEYIHINLRQTPRQLWEDIGANNGNVTEKQIHNWWMRFSQGVWKRNENQFLSAVELIGEHRNMEKMFHINEGGVTAIALSVKELLRTVGPKAVEVGIDATCKSYL